MPDITRRLLDSDYSREESTKVKTPEDPLQDVGNMH